MTRCLNRNLLQQSLLQQIRCTRLLDFRNVLKHEPSQLSACQQRHLCSKKGKILEGSTIMQHGIDIQELPVIVKKADDKDFFRMCKSNGADASNVEDKRPVMDNDFETPAMISGFQRCYSVKGVFKLLDVIPASEITPRVAVQALKTIITLENNHQYRNPFKNNEETSENFTRTAVFNNLIELIASCKDPSLLIQGLQLVSRDIVGVNKAVYRQKLSDELLLLVSEGKLLLSQVCEVVRLFALFNSHQGDKMWVGVFEKQMELTDKNAMEVFRILPYMRQSQRLIVHVIEQRIEHFWWKLSSKDVSEIVTTLSSIRTHSFKLIGLMSRWFNTNIHTLDEDGILCLVQAFLSLDQSQQGVEKALERYIKAKGLKIKNANVFAIIMEYCKKFRIRSPLILDAACEYFVANSSDFSPTIYKSMFCPLGLLDFHPSNSLEFWQVFEEGLDKLFIQLCPEDALDVMLSCIYLEKYPLNFVKKVFNPYFLDRLHSSRDYTSLQALRGKLKLFDNAMTIDCELYRGPLLPKDHSNKSVWHDMRIRRLSSYLAEQISELLPARKTISPCVLLTQLPLVDLYVVDLVVHSNSHSVFNLNLKKDENVGILIHVPEHYDSTGQHMTGPQVMRSRHLQRIGFKIIDLNYELLDKMKVHPSDLMSYIREKFSEVGLELNQYKS